MGLMGYYDGRNGNDFVSREGTPTSPGSGAEELYSNFAMTCKNNISISVSHRFI